MATLYQINEQILSCIDTESGEVVDGERLAELAVERDEKLENVALWIKNLSADAAMYKAEKEAFAEREKAAEQKAECLKVWLANALEGEKFSTGRVAVTFRKSMAVECDIGKVPEQYIVKKIERAPDKKAIGAMLKSGEKIDGCRLVERQNIQIR